MPEYVQPTETSLRIVLHHFDKVLRAIAPKVQPGGPRKVRLDIQFQIQEIYRALTRASNHSKECKNDSDACGVTTGRLIEAAALILMFAAGHMEVLRQKSEIETPKPPPLPPSLPEKPIDPKSPEIITIRGFLNGKWWGKA